jgi:hypothetical protein
LDVAHGSQALQVFLAKLYALGSTELLCDLAGREDQLGQRV